MSSPYETPFRVDLNAVPAYRVYLLGLFSVISLVLFFYTSLSMPIRLCLFLILLVVLYRQLQKLTQLPRRLVLQDGLDWVLQDQAGQLMTATLLNEGYISRWLIVMHFRSADQKRRSLAIVPLMLDADCFRRLTVYLKLLKFESFTDE